jgi:hypothetical protein
MPGGGMSMQPHPFPWRTIIEWRYPGVLTRKNLRTKGVVPSNSTKKIQFEENLCYLGFQKTMESLKADLLRVFFPDGSFKNQFLTVAALAAV